MKGDFTDMKYELKRWVVKILDDNRLLAWGNVFNNPNFYEGQIIHTSIVKDIILEDKDIIALHTANSIYYCDLKDVFPKDYSTQKVLCEKLSDKVEYIKTFFDEPVDVDEIVEKYGEDSDEFKNVIGEQFRFFGMGDMRAQFDNKILEHNAVENIENNTYIVCFDRSARYFVSAVLLKNNNGEIEKLDIEPYIHLGMFQDTILIRSEDFKFDFRYYYPQNNAYNVDCPEGFGLSVVNFGKGDINLQGEILQPLDVYNYDLSKNYM